MWLGSSSPKVLFVVPLEISRNYESLRLNLRVLQEVHVYLSHFPMFRKIFLVYSSR